MPQKLRPSYKFNEEQLRQLKQIVPEAFKDGLLDYNSLYDALSDYNEEDNIEIDDNFYGLYWPGKRKAKRTASIPPRGTLIPVKGDGVDEENTKNIYIEGDNLEVLKILQKSYAGKIKMIYIDPPYNTGNDFVYNDEFFEATEAFGKSTGRLDEQGIEQVKNINHRSDGRFHSNWLSMMYPRLKLAHSLLNEDGVIFISIDDNEVAQLRKICDEIFGEENFIAQINWRGRGGRQDSKYYAVIHEYIICYTKLMTEFIAGEEVKENDVYPKHDIEKGRNYKTQLLRKWGSNSKRENRPNLYYSIPAPDGNEIFPMLSLNEEGCWRWGKTRMQEAIKNGDVEFVKTDDRWIAYEKIWEPQEGEQVTKKYTSWIDDIGTGANVIKELFCKAVFDYPKPNELVKRFIKMTDVTDDDIILDFFSGSATTAHAVMSYNAEILRGGGVPSIYYGTTPRVM